MPVQAPPAVVFEEVTYGIGAVVDVEESALRAFEQDLLSLLQRVMQIDDGVGDERPQFFAGREKIRVHFREGDRSGAERLQDAVVLLHLGPQFFGEQFGLHQIGHAQAGARGFVAVGGTDAALGRADFGVSLAQLALFIERAVVRQDEVRAIADQQIPADRDADLAKAVDFADERDRVDDDAVADDADLAAPQNAGRDEMQNEFFTAVNDGVAGVVAALTADDDVGVLGKNVDDFAFAFIAPLRADQNRVCHRVAG